MADAVSARLTAHASRRELRSFALSVGGAFLALAALLSWRGRPNAALVLVVAGAILVAVGVAAPTRLGPVYRAWMTLALAMSRVTTPILMGLVYFGVLTPTGLVMRLFGRRPLPGARPAATVWVDRPAGARRSDLRRQF